MFVSFWALTAGDVYNVPLPDVVTWELSPIAGSPGAVTIDYPADGRNFEVLRDSVTQDRDLEIAIWTDGRDAGSLRAILMTADGDDVAEGAIWRFAGHFFEIRMEEEVVQPRTSVVTPPSGPMPSEDLAAFRVYSATAGSIMATLMQEAQADGYLTDITYDFTPTHDSNGVAWSTDITLKIAPGTELSKVLDSLVGAQMCEWGMYGRELRMFEVDTAGVDRTETVPPVILHAGGTILDSPRKHTVREAGTTLLLAGAEGLYAQVEDATAIARRGRKIRRYASQGSITSAGSLTAYGLAKLPQITAGQMEVGHGLTMQPGDPMPLRDFFVRDWVYSDTGRGLERLRVAQATVRGDQHGAVTAGVSLNDLIADELTRQAARLSGIEGGTTVTGTSQARPIDEGADTMPPATPLGLAATSDAYPVGDFTLSTVSLSWGAVTTNQDTTAISDLAGYRIRYRYVNPPHAIGWQDAGTRATTTADIDGLVPGVDMEFQVAAFDNNGNVSAWSVAEPVTTAMDSDPPPVPSAPVVTDFNGVLIITWNGLGSAGESQPIDFSHVVVHRSTTNNFVPDATSAVDEIRATPGATVFAGGTYGTTYYFRLVAVDRSGNPSEASGQGSAAPQRLVGDDLADGLITAAKLGAQAVTGPKIFPEAVSTPHLTVSAFSDNQIPNGGFEDVDLTDATKPHGWAVIAGAGTFTRSTAAADIHSGGAAGKVFMTDVSTVAVRLGSDTFPVKPGQIWHISASVRASRALTGFRFRIYVDSVDPPNPATAGVSNAGPLLAITTSFATYETNFTVPALVNGIAPRYMRIVPSFGDVVADTASADFFIDEVRARRVVGTAEIADASISTAKIGLLAVQDGNVANLSVGKLLTGTMSATLTVSGKIETSALPNRGIKMDSLGFRGYNEAGNNVVFIGTTTGAFTLFRPDGVTRALDFNPYTGALEVAGTFRSNVSGDRIEINPPAVAYPTIYFYDNQAGTNRAYINGIPVGSAPVRVALGLNSGADPLNNQTSLVLKPNQIDLFYNSFTGTPNQRRGGYLYLDQGNIHIGVTNSSAVNRALLALNSGGGASLTLLAGQELNCNQVVRAAEYFTSGGAAHLQKVGGTGPVYLAWTGAQLQFIEEQTGILLKTFVIDHPTPAKRDTHYLVHSTTESPHGGVEYWGVAEIEDGEDEVVTLPDYFEDLCADAGRAVILTVVEPTAHRGRPKKRRPKKDLGEYNGRPVLPAQFGVPQVSATYPRNGRFRICVDGTAPETLEVFWLVKAIRKDVPALLVEPRKDAVTVRGDGPYRYMEA